MARRKLCVTWPAFLVQDARFSGSTFGFLDALPPRKVFDGALSGIANALHLSCCRARRQICVMAAGLPAIDTRLCCGGAGTVHAGLGTRTRVGSALQCPGVEMEAGHDVVRAEAPERVKLRHRVRHARRCAMDELARDGRATASLRCGVRSR